MKLSANCLSVEIIRGDQTEQLLFLQHIFLLQPLEQTPINLNTTPSNPYLLITDQSPARGNGDCTARQF